MAHKMSGDTTMTAGRTRLNRPVIGAILLLLHLLRATLSEVTGERERQDDEVVVVKEEEVVLLLVRP